MRKSFECEEKCSNRRSVRGCKRKRLKGSESRKRVMSAGSRQQRLLKKSVSQNSRRSV